jgi:hypothetical protein
MSIEKGQMSGQHADSTRDVNPFFGERGQSNVRSEAVSLLGDKNTVAAAAQSRECPMPLAHGADLTNSPDRFSDVLKQATPADTKFDPSKALASEKADPGNRVTDAVCKAAEGHGTVRENVQNVHQLQPAEKKEKLAV